MRVIRVLVVGQRLILRESLRAILRAERDLEIVGEASNGLDAARLVRQLVPDVAVVDARLPHLPAREVVHSIHQSCPTAAIIVLTMFNNERTVSAMLQAGAQGHLLKDSAVTDVARVIRGAVLRQSRPDPEMSGS